MQHCPARLARGCQRARLHLDRCDAGMGMGAGARRWNWLVTHNRAAFSTCAAGCGAPTENCWRCRPHSRDALRHTRPMEASLRPRGQSGERSAAACGSPSKSRRSRPCGHGKLGLQHAVAAPATEPPAATSNHGPRQPPSRTQPQRAWGRARSGTGTGTRLNLVSHGIGFDTIAWRRLQLARHGRREVDGRPPQLAGRLRYPPGRTRC